MPRTIVMTIIGEDRPGLVESVASVVAEHGGNWLESRMVRLAGQFAGVLRIEARDPSLAVDLEEALRGLDKGGLTVVLASGDEPRASVSGDRLWRLELLGQDRPGIVSQISEALARHGVNVEELSTECTSAPMSAEALFKAEALILLPESSSLDAIRDELERIGSDLMVDISLAEAGSGL